MSIDITSETFTPSPSVVRTVTQYASQVPQGGTATYVITLNSLVNTDLDAVTLNLFDEETRAVINNRSNQDVLGVGQTGQNNVSIAANATITWSLTALDNIYVDPTRTKRIEFHIAIFTITVNADVLIHEVRFPVRKSFTVLEAI